MSMNTSAVSSGERLAVSLREAERLLGQRPGRFSTPRGRDAFGLHRVIRINARVILVPVEDLRRLLAERAVDP